MPGKTVETKFKATGVEGMKRQLKGIEKELKGIGKTGVDLKSGMAAGGAAIGGAIIALGAMKAAAEAATAATRALVGMMKELSDRGGSVSAVAARFETMGSPALLANLQRATGQLVNNLDLMRTSNVALANEMLTDDQWTQWSALVVRAAQDTEQDVTKSLDNMAKAFTGGGVEFLGPLGVEMGEVKDQVREAGKSMESAEGRMMALTIAGEMLTESYGEIDNSAGNTGDAVQQVMVAFQNLKDEVARVFAEDERLIGSLEDIAATIRGLMPHAAQFGRAFAELGKSMMEMAVASVPLVVSSLDTLLGSLQSMASAYADLLAAYNQDNDTWSNLANSIGNVRRGVNSLGDAFEAANDSAEDTLSTMREIAAMQNQQTEEGFAPESILNLRPGALDVLNGEAPAPAPTVPELPAPRRRRRGGARQQSATDRLMEEDVSATGLFDEIGERQDQLEQQRHELRMSRLNEQKDFEIELAEKRLEIDSASKAADLDHAQKMLAEQEKIKEAAEEAAAAIKKKIDQGTAIAQTAAGSLGTIGGAFGAMADKKEKDLEATRAGMREMGMTEKQITAATKDREKAVARARKAEGAFMVAQNVVLAATEVARAIGAIPNPVLIASHSAAAVAHVVAAGIAASKLGGGGGGGASVSLPPKPSVSEFTPAETDNIEQTTNNGPGQTNVVNYYSLGRSGEDLGRALKEAEYEFERSDGRAVTGAGVSYS